MPLCEGISSQNDFRIQPRWGPYTKRTWCIVYIRRAKTFTVETCVRACVRGVGVGVSLYYYYFVVCCHFFPQPSSSPPTFFLVWEPNQRATANEDERRHRLFWLSLSSGQQAANRFGKSSSHTHISSLVMTIEARNVNCSLHKRCVMCNPFHCGLQNSTDNSLPIQCQQLWAVKVNDVKKKMKNNEK
jgi:hypothetical protein